MSPGERRMYYHSFCAAAGRWTVGLATSRDGIAWRKQGPIFSGAPDGGGFDGGGAAACHVVRDGASRKCANTFRRPGKGVATTVIPACQCMSPWRPPGLCPGLPVRTSLLMRLQVSAR